MYREWLDEDRAFMLAYVGWLSAEYGNRDVLFPDDAKIVATLL